MNATSIIFGMIALVFTLASYTIVYTVLAQPLICPDCKVGDKEILQYIKEKLPSSNVPSGHNVIICQHDSAVPDKTKDPDLCRVDRP